MRESTENIYRQKANYVIDYISSHLHEPLKTDVIADKMNVSQRQLLRIMHSFLHESLHSYIARQRTERAVLYMQTGAMSLTDLAEKVGYDNPQSLSKAFKKHFGISPKAYMKELQLRLESAVKSSGNRHDEISSTIREEEEALELVYIRIFGEYGEKDTYEKAWNKLTDFLKKNEALTSDTRFIGISFDDPHVTKTRFCRFYACASVYKKITPTGEFGTLQVKKGKYAVYTLTGSYSGLQDLYNRISLNFEYTLRHGLAFEEYINNPRNTTEKELITEIFIPVK